MVIVYNVKVTPSLNYDHNIVQMSMHGPEVARVIQPKGDTTNISNPYYYKLDIDHTGNR